jgi:phage gp45-like
MASPLAKGVQGLIKIGQAILSTTIEAATNKILVQLGDVRGGTDSDNAEQIQHVGFVSRPSKAQKGKAAAYAVVVEGGDRDVVIGSIDQRGLELYGSLKEGEAAVYAAGEDGTGQARILLKADGGVHIYSRKGNSPTGTGMTISLDAQNGAIRLVNDKGYGLIIDGDGVKLTTGDAALSLTGSGDVTLVGKGKTQVDGSGILLGSAAVPGLNSALTGPTGLAGVASAKVLISTA